MGCLAIMESVQPESDWIIYICQIRLPTSDSVPFFQRRPRSYCVPGPEASRCARIIGPSSGRCEYRLCVCDLCMSVCVCVCVCNNLFVLLAVHLEWGRVFWKCVLCESASLICLGSEWVSYWHLPGQCMYTPTSMVLDQWWLPIMSSVSHWLPIM